MLKYSFVLFLSIVTLLLTFSCSEEEKMSVYTVSNKDFEDILIIDGIVEPVQSMTIPCPRGINGGIITFIAEDGSYIKKGDTICIIEDESRESRYEKMVSDMEKEVARLAKARVDADMEYALLDAQVKNNEVSANIAQLDSLQLLYASPTERKIKELELKQVMIERNKFKKKLTTLDIIQKSDIRKIELRIVRLQNTMDNMKQRIEEQTLIAPQDGILVRENHYGTGNKIQVGDQVWARMPIASIPTIKNMKVKISASERDFKSINNKDKIRYVFDAMPNNIGYGQVTKKAPVGTPIKQDSKVKFFDIEASIDSVPAMPDPGFSAICHITLKQVKDTIVIPQIAIFEEDSIKVAYVKKDKGFEKRQILTGLFSSKEAIISAGLNRNEIIALSKPKLTEVKSTKLLPDSITKPQKTTP